MLLQLKQASTIRTKAPVARGCCGASTGLVAKRVIISKVQKLRITVYDENFTPVSIEFKAGVPREVSDFIGNTIMQIHNSNNRFEVIEK